MEMSPVVGHGTAILHLTRVSGQGEMSHCIMGYGRVSHGLQKFLMCMPFATHTAPQRRTDLREKCIFARRSGKLVWSSTWFWRKVR